ncbi:MAG TPA: hypothetical protein VIR58_08300, partial [Acidimicrobiales bacterium]
ALGWVVVAAYAALLVATALTTPADRRPATGSGSDTAESALIEAWARSRTGTFVTTGTFERRSDVTGASIASEDVLAQRPPRRLHSQMGGVEGRDDERLLVCPAPPPDSEPEPCRYGPAGGPTYAEATERELAGLRSLVGGTDPLYGVTVDDAGCFHLELRRSDPRATFGQAAELCFDDETGALVRREVHHEGGIVEVLEVDEVRADVSDADLAP